MSISERVLEIKLISINPFILQISVHYKWPWLSTNSSIHLWSIIFRLLPILVERDRVRPVHTFLWEKRTLSQIEADSFIPFFKNKIMIIVILFFLSITKCFYMQFKTIHKQLKWHDKMKHKKNKRRKHEVKSMKSKSKIVNS